MSWLSLIVSKVFFGFYTSLNRFFFGRKLPQVGLGDVCAPLPPFGPAHASFPASIVAVLTHVLSVFRWAGCSKVAWPIVSSDSVNVVNFFRKGVTVKHCPYNSVGQDTLIQNGSCFVSINAYVGKGFLASISRVPIVAFVLGGSGGVIRKHAGGSLFPEKLSAVAVKFKKSLDLFGCHFYSPRVDNEHTVGNVWGNVK